MVNRVARNLSRSVALIPAALLAIGLAGCSVKHQTGSVVQGKQLFSAKCGACHALAHAGTTGTIGPNLDVAFAQDRRDHFSNSEIQGLVAFQIEFPNTQGAMPAMLYSGSKADDVAAYVARVAAEPGTDTGALANAGTVTGTTPAAGKQVFTGVGTCASCHTLTAAGSTGTVGPNLNTIKTACAAPASQKVRGSTLRACIQKAIVDPYAYIPPGYTAGVMPSNFGTRLKPNEITALVNFIAGAAK
ncbi:MAG TPA: c-type cytochrome [Solirubrobacteraceae bacterium]|jgi:mono/diheme cytochrome c family protein|nr:c-type cytochrome [Solirubrobacteraceae bacterium]